MRSRNIYFIFSIILSIAFLISSAFSQGQQKIPLSINGGVSIPVNEFASSTGSDAGFATFGYSLSLDYKPVTNKLIKLYTTLTLTSNSIDKGVLRQKSVEQIAPLSGIDQQYSQQFLQLIKDNTSVYESGSYYSVFLLTGPEIETQLSSDINISGAVQIGLLHQSKPVYRIIYTGLGYEGQGFLYQPQASLFTFAYSLSASIEIDRFRLSMKYISAEPVYNISRSYMFPARVTINSNNIDIPASSQFGNINIAKEPASIIIVYLGFVLFN